MPKTMDTRSPTLPTVQRDTQALQSQSAEVRAGMHLRAVALEQECREALLADVLGMTDDQRERFIVSTGELMLRAYRLGQREDAVQLQQCMYAAIHARSPAKRQEMAVEIERRIADGIGYFSSDAAVQLGRSAMGSRR